MRIGMVCPYSFDVPGGVQAHVLQLAEVMLGYGHEVSVLAPFSPDATLPAEGAPIDALRAGFKTEVWRRAMELAL